MRDADRDEEQRQARVGLEEGAEELLEHGERLAEVAITALSARIRPRSRSMVTVTPSTVFIDVLITSETCVTESGTHTWCTVLNCACRCSCPLLVPRTDALPRAGRDWDGLAVLLLVLLVEGHVRARRLVVR